MNFSYIYEIKIMGRNILTLPFNKILFFLTSQASKNRRNCCNLGEGKFWGKKKTNEKNTKKTNNQWKIFLGCYLFHCPLHHDVQFWNLVELEERMFFSSSSCKKWRSFLEELGKATEWFLSVIDSEWTSLLHILLQWIWHLE